MTLGPPMEGNTEMASKIYKTENVATQQATRLTNKTLITHTVIEMDDGMWAVQMVENVETPDTPDTPDVDTPDTPDTGETPDTADLDIPARMNNKEGRKFVLRDNSMGKRGKFLMTTGKYNPWKFHSRLFDTYETARTHNRDNGIDLEIVIFEDGYTDTFG